MSMPLHVPELQEIQKLTDQYGQLIRIEELGQVNARGDQFPLLGLVIGNKEPTAPTFGLFAGVHGLERVGSHVLLSFLSTLMNKYKWDKQWQSFFERNRLVTIPIINPSGFALNRRSNAQGVDLMRNAPVQAKGKLLWGVSGHHYGPWMPWYRGSENLEIETLAVESFAQKYIYPSKAAVSLDLHSGFGMKDRLWYPWAHSSEAFPHIDMIDKMTAQFEKIYPYHIYKIEPQHHSYMTHGDLWDWLYINHQKQSQAPYLPFTLEMGSWMWVKKNPWQALWAGGFFNPVKKHRYARTMRRHVQLIEFFLSAIDNHRNWA
jgi:hypothetical protein